MDDEARRVRIPQLPPGLPDPAHRHPARIIGSGDLWAIEMLFDYDGDRFHVVVIHLRRPVPGAGLAGQLGRAGTKHPVELTTGKGDETTMEATAPHPISRDDGERVSLGGLDIIFKITGDQTGGALAICEVSVEPGRLIPAHLHDTEDEFSYVIDGRIGVLIGDEELTADAGSWVVKPRGIPHTFWNPGPHHARTIEVITPAGFERFFRELGAIFSADGPPDTGRLATTAASYHHHFRPDLEQPLTDKHHLRVIGT